LNFSSGFLKDLAYIRFSILIFNTGEDDKAKEQSEPIQKFIKQLRSNYDLLASKLSKNDLKKVDKHHKKILDFFIKKTVAAPDVDNIAVELLATFILKYRFSMFRKKVLDASLVQIIDKKEILELIKEVMLTIEKDRNVSFEISLAKEISKAY
jgi:hypothetical protein